MSQSGRTVTVVHDFSEYKGFTFIGRHIDRFVSGCHRQLLADAFFAREWTVRHIMDNGCHEHKLPPFAQLAGKQIYYRG